MSISKFLLCLVPVAFLAACSDTGLDSYDDSDDYSSGTVKSSILQCPSSCNTGNSNANMQVASLCDGARSYYNEYKLAVQKYGTSGAEPYWDAYAESAGLANDMYSEYGCASGAYPG